MRKIPNNEILENKTEVGIKRTVKEVNVIRIKKEGEKEAKNWEFKRVMEKRWGGRWNTCEKRAEGQKYLENESKLKGEKVKEK